MKSMTGFGYREYQDDRLRMTLELKGYNNRYLDIAVSLPPFLSPLENRVREEIAKGIPRGRVEVSLKVRETEEGVTVSIDRGAVRAYAGALRELAELAEIEEPLHLSHLLRLEGVLKAERERNLEDYWDRLRPLLRDTLAEFESSRVREGRALEADILSQIGLLEQRTALIEEHVPELESTIRDSLRQRFREVLGNEADEGRIYTETAVMLVRYTINEEIVRIRAHLSSFRENAAADGPVGKKLDFICQELNREINTIGSKSILVPVSQAVIDMKDALENIREQLRNLE